MDRFAQQSGNCSEEGCGEPAAGKFMSKSLCKNHLQAYMGRAQQEIPVADQGIANSKDVERLKYEKFKHVLKDQIGQGETSLKLDAINDQLHLFEKDSKVAQVSADHEHEFETGDVPGTFTCSCGLDAWYDRDSSTYNVELHHDPEGDCDIISGDSWDELKDSMRKRIAQGTHCYICGGPVSKGNSIQVNVDGRKVLRHKNPALCDEFRGEAYYAEPDSVLDDASDPMEIIASTNIVCAMCGDDWDTSTLDYNKTAALVEGHGCPTCGGAPLCTGCSHKFASHNNGCQAEEIRFDRRLAKDVTAKCDCAGYDPLSISYYEQHLESKFAAGTVVGWPAEAQPPAGTPFPSATGRPTGYPPRADDDVEFQGQDHPEDDEGGNDDFPGADLLEGVAHQQDHLRQYKKDVFSHDVPVKHIVDHLGELAERTYPATCKLCGEAMELHAQWEPTKQASTSRWKSVFNFIASFGREDVPATFITDHLGELATGVEPATCKVCGEVISRHAQWLPTKQAQGTWKPETDDDFFVHDEEKCSECDGNNLSFTDGVPMFLKCDDCDALFYTKEHPDVDNAYVIDRVPPFFDGRIDTDDNGVALDIDDPRRREASSHDHGGYTLTGHPGAFRIVPTETCGFCGDKS